MSIRIEELLPKGYVSDRRLFVDQPISRTGDWLWVPEWAAHTGLSLPDDWLMLARPREDAADAIERYVALAHDCEREPVRFNPRHRTRDDWWYQSVKGQAPLAINADVKDFFESRTPGSRWWMFETRMLRNRQPVRGHAFARIHPELGVRFIVAACDPRWTGA